jgi:hypothetical protein
VPDYPRVPDQCAFFNNKFLILSSLVSFFIPCIIIFAIYYRVLMVIMARAKKNRKQLRPKAAIQSAAAQHRSNVNHLVTSILQDRQDLNHPATMNDSMVNKTSAVPNNSPIVTNASIPLTNNNGLNALALKISTPALTVGLRPSINATSSSGDQADDDERDDVALFVDRKQKHCTNKDEHANQIEILPSKLPTSNVKFDGPTDFPTSCQSQTETHSQHITDSSKTRLQTETKSYGLPVPTNITQTNSTKTAKRKVYSRMKKERKATQTLIIVLSMFLNDFLLLSFYQL